MAESKPNMHTQTRQHAQECGSEVNKVMGVPVFLVRGDEGELFHMVTFGTGQSN